MTSWKHLCTRSYCQPRCHRMTSSVIYSSMTSYMHTVWHHRWASFCMTESGNTISSDFMLSRHHYQARYFYLDVIVAIFQHDIINSQFSAWCHQITWGHTDGSRLCLELASLLLIYPLHVLVLETHLHLLQYWGDKSRTDGLFKRPVRVCGGGWHNMYKYSHKNIFKATCNIPREWSIVRIVYDVKRYLWYHKV